MFDRCDLVGPDNYVNSSLSLLLRRRNLIALKPIYKITKRKLKIYGNYVYETRSSRERIFFFFFFFNVWRCSRTTLGRPVVEREREMGSSVLRTFEAEQVFHFSTIQDKKEKFPVLSCCDCFFSIKRIFIHDDWMVDYVHDTHAIEKCSINKWNETSFHFRHNISFSKNRGDQTREIRRPLTMVDVWVRNNTIWEMSERGDQEDFKVRLSHWLASHCVSKNCAKVGFSKKNVINTVN